MHRNLFTWPARRWPAAALAAALTVLAAGSAMALPGASPARTAAGTAGAAPAGPGARPACQAPAPGRAACLAITDTNVHWTGHAWVTGGPAPATRPAAAPHSAQDASGAPAPFLAADLQAAYRLPSSLLGSRQTIAVVDAYDNPNAAADLAAYRDANGLPGCDAANPCFAKVNQRGQQGSYPPADTGWAVEESLDVDMASAICPNCTIMLVEADDSTVASLAAAEDEAARLGASVISNSWGAAEFNETVSFAADFTHPGVAITASTGDAGFFTGFPADVAAVTAVGGTSLFPAPGTPRGWAETAWGLAGSGCSAYIAKPAWQHDTLCGMRTVADVAAVADPVTPVAVYDTTGEPGWIAVGGTSVAAPLIAGVYALAGNAKTIGSGASYAYAHRKYLSDVTAGGPFDENLQATGNCGGSYLCAAGPGYDGPTGLGSPDGTGAF